MHTFFVDFDFSYPFKVFLLIILTCILKVNIMVIKYFTQFFEKFDFFDLLPISMFCLVCVLPSFIIGAIAVRKGRSFVGWTFSPVLITFGITVYCWLIFEITDGSIATMIFYVFTVLWFIHLIAILIAGKTYKKRMQDIVFEERIRASIKHQNEQHHLHN
jgi:hypothetical protein